MPEGQTIFWFNGPNLASASNTSGPKIYADYKVTTKLPVAKYVLRLTAGRESGWSQFVYGEPPMIHIGAKAEELKRVADFYALNADRSFAAVTEIDLSDCEKSLSTK